MRKKFLLIFLIVALTGGKIFSQELDAGGSPYSIFGIGDLNYYTSTRTYSMGILGTSLFGNYINNLNPATMTKLNATTISINGNYGFLKSTNGTLQNNVSNGNVLGINIAIPFDQVRGWTFSLGFNPMSLMNYKIRVRGNIGGQNYQQLFSGKGGLSRINTGMSYNLLQKISIGLEYNFAFGEIKNQNFIDFSNANYTNSNIQKNIDFQRSFLKGGIVFEVGKILKNSSLRDFSIGAFFQSGFNMSATLDGIYKSSIGTDTVRLNNGVIEIPDAYGFGITNIFGQKYLVSGDILFQDWSKFKEFGNTLPNYQSTFRAGLGVEIMPDENSPTFSKRMTYRFGGFYDKAFFIVNNQDILSYGVRAGINIPLSKFNSLDFGINYSIRGKTSDGLIKDEFFNLTAGINFGELWFLRPREEDK